MTEGWITATLPLNEKERLQALYDYQVLDTIPEESFDRITRLASIIFKTPIALVSLVDGERQWFKSRAGLDATETPRDLAFCAHAILQDEVFIVPNTLEDDRFYGNPLVAGKPDIRFYAGAPLKTPDGFNVGTLCVIDSEAHVTLSDSDQAILSDLAALVVDELELRTAKMKALQANEAKSKFLAMISHEIRTPMSAIIGFADMLIDTPLTETQQEYLSTIRSSGEGLLDIINNVLDITEIEAGKLELEHIPFSIKSIVNDVVRLFSLKATEKKILLGITYLSALPDQFIGDPCRFRQILMNLIGNAIKFTDKGQIMLHMFFDEQQHKFHCSIIDTGIGIKEENLSRIFDAFSQEDMTVRRRYGGTGLGLAICKRMIEIMGGELTVTSVYGSGTTVNFTLAIDKNEIPVPVTTISQITDKIHANILVVDDLSFNQRIAKNIFTKMGCTVDVASSGAEAITAISNANYDIIFMDVQMPDMDGMETTRLIRRGENGKHHIIVAMTASALSADRDACMECGMDDFTSKPLQLDKLLEVVQKYAPAG